MRIRMTGKLAASFGTVLVLTGAVGYFGISSLSSSNDLLTRFAERPFVQVQGAKTAQVGLESIERTIFLSMLSSDEDLLKSAREDYGAAWTAINENIARSIASLPEDVRLTFAEILTSARSLQAVLVQAFEVA